MRTARSALTLLLVTALAAAGCSSIRVATDWDRDYSFSALHTYSWAVSPETPKDAPESAFLDRRIRRAVDDALAAKGYEKREGTADFLVVYQAKVHDRYDVYRSPSWRGWNDVRRYREGTLVLGIVDRARDEIVWSGWAEGIVSEPGAASEEVIREAVTKMLEGFPPR